MLSRKSIPSVLLISTFLASSCFLRAAYASEAVTEDAGVEEVEIGDGHVSSDTVLKDKEAPKTSGGSTKKESGTPSTPAKKEVREEKKEKKGDDEEREAPVTSVGAGTSSGGLFSYVTDMFARLKFSAAVRWDPENEKAKFRDLNLADLLERLEEGDDHTAIRNKNIRYKTGTLEGSSDYYDGYLIFNDLDYGTIGLRYLGLQGGIDRNMHLTSRRDALAPRKFIEDLITNGKGAAGFDKGTPAKLSDTTTSIDYMFVNLHLMQYVTVKASRKKATDMPSDSGGIVVGKGVVKPKSEDEVD
jgi:hypothetical protein